MSTVPVRGSHLTGADSERQARMARFAPLLMLLWLPVSFVVGMTALDALGYAADTEAPDQSIGQWIFTILFNGAFVVAPLIGGLVLAMRSRARGAGRAARSALWVNGGILLAWYALMINATLQDFFGY